MIPYRHQRRTDYDDEADNQVSYVPSKEIDYSVVSSDSKHYLGRDASVRQEGYPKDNLSRYYIPSSTKLTVETISKPMADSNRRMDEPERYEAPDYMAPSTNQKRHQCDAQSFAALNDLKLNEYCGIPSTTDSHSAYPKKEKEVPVVETAGGFGQPGLSRRQTVRSVNETSTGEAARFCAPLGGISLASLRDVHSYLTEIGHIIGLGGGKTYDVYSEFVRLKSFLRALRKVCENEPRHE